MSAPPLSTADLPPSLLPAARLVGYTPFVASTLDRRCSYALYIPPEHYNPSPSRGATHPSALYSRARLPLIVAVHGSTRAASALLDALAPLATRARAAVLAPLFPAGLESRNDWDSYKAVRTGNGGPDALRGDLVLGGILEEVGQRWPGIDAGRGIVLAGFSGGASFAQRFALCRPRIVRAVSLAAPGSLAQLTGGAWQDGGATAPGWPGVSERELRGIGAWQLVVGSEDEALEGSLETLAEVSEMWKSREEGGGQEVDWVAEARRRMKRRKPQMEEFARGLGEWGIRVEVEVVGGAGHVLGELMPAVERFLEREVEAYWTELGFGVKVGN